MIAVIRFATSNKNKRNFADVNTLHGKCLPDLGSRATRLPSYLVSSYLNHDSNVRITNKQCMTITFEELPSLTKATEFSGSI